jgi:hypothetical protein
LSQLHDAVRRTMPASASCGCTRARCRSTVRAARRMVEAREPPRGPGPTSRTRASPPGDADTCGSFATALSDG